MLKLKNCSSFKDFLEQVGDKEFYIINDCGYTIVADYCLNYDNSSFFSFANGYSEAKLNKNIRENMHLFDVRKTNKFYYANDNMHSCSNAMHGIWGLVLKLKEEFK